MSAATMTFDQMERGADRNLAIVLWAKHVKYTTLCTFFLAILNASLKQMTDGFSSEKLGTLSSEQAIELTKRLQDLHAHLVSFLAHRSTKEMASRFLYRGSLAGLEERSEELFDIIEEMVLAENKEFKSLLSECVETINSHRQAGALARMWH